jgi:NAD(P)-dependent dehydrogenase (short-subunit alcohol dehydrogenase family)
MTLKDQTVVILGGSSGIGLATARAALAEGARVTITGRSRERLEAARRALETDLRTVALDVTDEPGTRDFFASFDHVDHVFITAGVVSFDPKLAPATDAMRPALETRFLGALFAAKYAAPRMGAGGSITFMSGAAVATASCAAIESFARALALDLAPIRVNTIQPGLVDTPFLEAFGDRRAAVIAEYSRRLPVKRPGRPEEIADGVIFLMKNGFVTGTTLTIDGGGLLT